MPHLKMLYFKVLHVKVPHLKVRHLEIMHFKMRHLKGQEATGTHHSSIPQWGREQTLPFGWGEGGEPPSYMRQGCWAGSVLFPGGRQKETIGSKSVRRRRRSVGRFVGRSVSQDRTRTTLDWAGLGWAGPDLTGPDWPDWIGLEDFHN